MKLDPNMTQADLTSLATMALILPLHGLLSRRSQVRVLPRLPLLNDLRDPALTPYASGCLGESDPQNLPRFDRGRALETYRRSGPSLAHLVAHGLVAQSNGGGSHRPLRRLDVDLAVRPADVPV